MTDDFYRLSPTEQGERLQVLATEALRHWDLQEAELTLIALRENAVFKVEDPAGRRCAMRVHRHGYHTDAELWSEQQWTAALRSSGLDLPVTIFTGRGEGFCLVQSPAVPEARQVELMAWVEGRSMAEILAEDPEPAALLNAMDTLGQQAARIHNQAADWQPPAGFVRHAWDADGLAGANPFWGRFWELPDLTASQRELMIAARDRVHADLTAYGKHPQTYSLIHADLLPENMLLEAGTVRIIDFDDAGFGWHQFELATVLATYLGSDQYEQIESALTAGYRRERPFSDEALARMPLFILARVLTWLGWSLTRYETETAQLIRPFVIELACSQAENYLAQA